MAKHVIVGSKNPSKVEAVRELLTEYPLFAGCNVTSVDVSSGVSEQPMSLAETVKGAINRAKAAYDEERGDYGVGIESGLVAVEQTITGYFDVSVCAIFDGKRIALGTSSMFEYPPTVIQKVLRDGDDISQAALKAGMTHHPKVGNAEGMVGILTKGRLPRKDYSKQAVRTALIAIENPDLYP